MSEPSAPISLLEDASSHAGPPPRPDLTGRDRMAWNVFAGWAGYFVMAIAGFLAPRVMDRSLGQESLGVWDFGWSLVTYFNLTQLGVGEDRPDGTVGILPAVFTDAGRIGFDVARIFSHLVGWCGPRPRRNRDG